jgi:hypothetical protein
MVGGDSVPGSYSPCHIYSCLSQLRLSLCRQIIVSPRVLSQNVTATLAATAGSELKKPRPSLQPAPGLSNRGNHRRRERHRTTAGTVTTSASRDLLFGDDRNEDDEVSANSYQVILACRSTYVFGRRSNFLEPIRYSPGFPIGSPISETMRTVRSGRRWSRSKRENEEWGTRRKEAQKERKRGPKIPRSRRKTNKSKL